MFPARVRGETGRRQAGFNVIELVVVILIVAALAVVALPSMSRLISTQRAKSTAFDLMADLAYARSEAISRGKDVEMVSAGGGKSWNGGWTIRESPGGPVLREGEARGSGIDVTGNAALITFAYNGRATAAGVDRVNFAIALKDTDAQDFQQRCVTLRPSGQARSALGLGECQ